MNEDRKVKMIYQGGTVLISGAWAPYTMWDDRLGAYRAFAIHYPLIRRYLESAGYQLEDDVLELEDVLFEDIVELKPVQKHALDSWEKAGRRGIVVLPTGTGKTYVALKAMARLSKPTLIIVPTIDLLSQWGERVQSHLGYESGYLGGGKQEIRGVTIATYDSAYLWAERLGNRFILVVFDEVHHLPAQSYRRIAEFSAAPYRLGLTATPEREDGLDRLYPMLVGGIVYSAGVKELAGVEIAPFKVRRVYVDLTPEERRTYDEDERLFTEILKRLGLRMRSQDDFQRLVRLTARNREARKALLARLEMNKIAMNSRAKMEKLREILAETSTSSILIFTRYNKLAYDISREFLIPVITHETPKKERGEILGDFRRGIYRAVVTSTVLDEGIDVPDATLAVVLGGFGTSRQFVQRLGRVVRKREGKTAEMIEVVAKGTLDYYLSRRRRHATLGASKDKDKEGSR